RVLRSIYQEVGVLPTSIPTLPLCFRIYRETLSRFSCAASLGNLQRRAAGVEAWPNLGNTVSGFNNTSTVGHLTAAFNSGVNNIGQMLLGFFSPGAGP
ncbi:hypothetical protein ABLN72_12550, partial [Mycobacterium tuberculosis]